MKKPLLNKIFIGSLVTLSAVLVTTQAFTITDLFNKINSNNGIIELEKPPVKDVEIDPSTIVTEGVKDNVFEAEVGHYEGVTGWAGEVDHKCVATSYLINQNFSGSICLTNISRGNASKNNTLSFTFNSDKDEIVNMDVTVTGLSSDTLFSKVVKTTVNDEPYGCDGTVLSDKNGVFVAQHYTTHFNHSLSTVTVPIKLKAGENTIKFSTRLTGENTMFGFDCINVKTTANLTGFVPEFWSLHDEDLVARLTPAPTANTTGVIQLYHEIESCGANVYYPMPSIGDGYANNTYTRDDNVSNNTFDYYFPNKEVGIQIGTVNKGPFKLTIDSPYVKVNAGGNSLDIIATEGIDESLITITPPYGKKVVGWYNAANKNEYWMGSTYRMPERNVTIRPIFDGEQYVSQKDVGTAADVYSGKVKITNALRDSACAGTYSTQTVKSNLKDTIIVTPNNEADTAVQFNCASGMKTGDQLATMIPCYWMDGSKKLTTVLQNQGTAALSFDFFIFTSGGSPEKAKSTPLSLSNGQKAYTTVTLNPGEVIELNWDMPRGHNTMMHGFYFNADASNFSLAMYQYIDCRHTLTLTGHPGITFEDGSTSALVEPHVGAPKIKTTLAEGEVLTGFVAGEDRYKPDLSDFVMGLSNVTLKATVSSNPVERTLTIEGDYAKFKDNSSQAKLYSDAPLPEGIIINAPTGMKHVGWVNVKTNDYYKDNSFVMPNENTTIAPVFDYSDDSKFLDSKTYDTSGNATDGSGKYADNARSGKAKLYDYGTPTGMNPIRVDQSKGFGLSTAGDVSNFMKTGAVKTAAGYYEKSASFHYDGAINKDDHFTLFKTQQNWNSSSKKVVEYSFTNYGNEDLTFTIHFATSSGNPLGTSKASKQFTIKAGESTSINWDIGSLQKDSLLLYVNFDSPTTNGINLSMNIFFNIEGK